MFDLTIKSEWEICSDILARLLGWDAEKEAQRGARPMSDKSAEVLSEEETARSVGQDADPDLREVRIENVGPMAR